MPLGPVTGDNIAQLIREGYPRDQAIAIALSHAKKLENPMGLKLILNVIDDRSVSTDDTVDFRRQAKVYRDSEWQEYRVKFFIDGVHQKEADYHTTSRDDAISTANHWVTQTPRRGHNPEKGPAGSEIATPSEMGAFIDELDRITLYAVPIGKVRVGVNAWEAGQVFQAVNPHHWTGSPFFRVSDAQRIYDMGYRKIIIMGGAGDTFDVDLVMQ